ncbi:phytanoyl-CoA dioxygenase family protein [Roseovarius sp. E0-M6]|uniref:phytanoyl-CoA dioxygenase family protein n=1 Tax=Roseovarius sp. E0-M6 TaxID=3127118 RepID=UPI00301018FD
MQLDHPEIDVDAMLSLLQRDGVVTLPGLYTSIIDTLAEQHVQIFKPLHPLGATAVSHDGECIVPTSPVGLRAHGCDTLAMALSPRWFSALAQRYFNASAPIPVSFVSLALDHEKQDPTGPGNHHPHWDPSLSLRLMLYISDVSKETGAIEIVRGTHYANHLQRLKEWKDNRPYVERPECAGLGQEFETLEASAGSVLVFDTSLTHRRGLLQPGTQRRVGFGHIQSDLAQRQLAGVPYQDILAADLHPHGNAYRQKKANHE